MVVGSSANTFEKCARHLGDMGEAGTQYGHSRFRLTEGKTDPHLVDLLALSNGGRTPVGAAVKQGLLIARLGLGQPHEHLLGVRVRVPWPLLLVMSSRCSPVAGLSVVSYRRVVWQCG